MADKRYIQIYALFCILAAILIVAAFLTDSGEQIQEDAFQFAGHAISADSITSIGSNTQEYLFTTDTIKTGAFCLIFFTRHRFVDVYMDGSLTYSLQIENPRFGNTAGCLWNFVEIPYGTKQAIIRIRSSYASMQNEKITFYCGKPKAGYEYLLKRALPALILGIINILLGLILTGCWIFTRKHVKSIRFTLLYTGLFSAIIGLWSIMESEISTLMLKNQQAGSFFRYIMVLLMSIPFLLFVKEFMQIEDRPGWKLLFKITLIWIPINLGLQLLEICDMKQIVSISHLFLAAILGYMVLCAIGKLRNHPDQNISFYKVLFGGTILLTVSFIINLAGYYTGRIMVELIGQTGFLLFIFLIGIASAKEIFDVFEAGKKAEIYRTLAIKAVLTGMYNRNAYIEEIDKIQNLSNTMIVTFDLNNLKQCNDQKGHMYGDKYLIAAAQILNNVFAHFGNCYRIGGDEFCVILNNLQNCNILDLIQNIESQEEQFNKSSKEIFMQIACGYAVFDASLDSNIEATRSRADEMMYENKKQLKAAANKQKEIGRNHYGING